MGKNLYSKKEKAIFNGLIDLLKKGANPYLIKVSDIARAANIGKGTIYDYFSSKEEAISEAILYNLINEIESGYVRIKSRESFKEKFYETLAIVTESVESNMSTFNMLISMRGVQDFYEYLLAEEADLSKCIAKVGSVIDHLIDAGIKEGIVARSGSYYYQTMTINSAIIGLAQYASQPALYPNVCMNEAMEASYELVTKALK